MVRLNPRHMVLVLAVALVMIAGCYESKFALGPKEQAIFERSFAGDWEAAAEQAKVHIVIRNFNDKEYYVEWDAPGERPLRMSGFLIDVKGATFAHLRGLTEDGSLPDKYLIVRVALADGKLSLRQLNDKYFEGKPIDSQEQFRKLVEENLDNDEMYDKEASVVAVRVPPENAPSAPKQADRE